MVTTKFTYRSLNYRLETTSPYMDEKLPGYPMIELDLSKRKYDRLWKIIVEPYVWKFSPIDIFIGVAMAILIVLLVCVFVLASTLDNDRVTVITLLVAAFFALCTITPPLVIPSIKDKWLLKQENFTFEETRDYILIVPTKSMIVNLIEKDKKSWLIYTKSQEV